jgi:hypothetical protein
MKYIASIVLLLGVLRSTGARVENPPDLNGKEWRFTAQSGAVTFHVSMLARIPDLLLIPLQSAIY